MTHVLGQEKTGGEVQDFESWSSITLKLKIKKKLTFGLQEQMRLDQNSTEIKGFFTQFTTHYELLKNFKVGVGLRVINKYDNEGKKQGYEHFFRYQFDASYQHKIERFKFNYRLRYQNRNELNVTQENGDIHSNHLRFKARIGYNIRKWDLDPVVSGEVANHFEEGVNYGLVGYRVTFGTNYKFKKSGKVGVFYRMEQELNSAHPNLTHILRVKYTYTFKI